MIAITVSRNLQLLFTTGLCMTKKQAKKVDMLALIVLFFEKFDGEFNDYQPLVDQIVIYLLKEKAIRDLLAKQGYGSHGKTLTKASLRQIMIDYVLRLSRKAYAWALTTGDVDMQNTFDLTDADFRLEQDSLIVLVDKLLKKMNDNLLALTPYKITLLNLTEAQTDETNFINFKELPKQQQLTKKTITSNIRKELKAADKILDICDNLIIGEFEVSNPDLVKEYNFDRIVNYSVARHTMVKVHVFGDEEHSEPISGASVGIVSLNRFETTNIDGEGDIVQFKGGDYILQVKAVGFEDAEIPFSIKRGKQIDIDVVMKAIAIS